MKTCVTLFLILSDLLNIIYTTHNPEVYMAFTSSNLN